MSGSLTTVTWDPPSIPVGGDASLPVTVPGAMLGDFAMASFDQDVTDLALSADVTAANEITCTLHNSGSGARDLASGTLRVKWIPKDAI